MRRTGAGECDAPLRTGRAYMNGRCAQRGLDRWLNARLRRYFRDRHDVAWRNGRRCLGRGMTMRWCEAGLLHLRRGAGAKTHEVRNAPAEASAGTARGVLQFAGGVTGDSF